MKIKPEKTLLGFISVASTEHVDLIAHLFLNTFFSATANLVKEFFENESIPVSCRLPDSVFNEDESFINKALAGRKDPLLRGLIKFGVAHWSSVGPHNAQEPLFSKGKLVVEMMSP